MPPISFAYATADIAATSTRYAAKRTEKANRFEISAPDLQWT